ncbi:putative membrane protein [Actimicrobium sp. GrIS 1.19]|uniref:DUF2177 family protein n=1 Tax=Actimicrobium sp. GrIS 1.19 TaxID=3071708 RepID=UPI002DF9CE66|nr:putative membrane protein [Actimicrobium sp. GrIS 1.19]
MLKYVLAYAATAIAFCALDFAWLTLVAPKFYQAQIGALLLEKPNLLPALLFYALYVAGLVVFCVSPGMQAGQWTRALLLGGLLGLVAYATYDLSNLATLKGWTGTLSLVDISWGVIVSAAASAIGYGGALMADRFSG